MLEGAVAYGQRLFPGDDDMLLRKAHLLSAKGQHEQALSLLQDLERRNPDNTDIQYALGAVYSALEQPRRAIQYYQKASRDGYELGMVYGNIADEYYHLGRDDEAIRYYRKAIAANPDEERSLYNLASGLNELGRDEEAYTFFDRFVHDHPYNKVGWYCLGNILMTNQRFESAIDAFEYVLTGSCIAAEAYTCCGGVAHVAEYHSHYADGGAPFVRNSFHLTIEDGALVHPAAEHGADGAPELFLRIGGEVAAGLFLDGGLEENDEFLEALNAEVLVEHYALLFLHLLDDGLERVDVFLVDGLHAEHYVAVHLYEAAVAVIYEVGVLGLGYHTLGHLVVKTEVEDGVHHAGHRGTCAGTYTDEQRVLGVAEAAVHQGLGVGYGCVDVVLEKFYDFLLTDLIILIASVGGDGEARGYGNTDVVHLSQVGALATKQLAHLCITFGLSVAKGVNSFGFFHCKLYIYFCICF